MKKALYCLIIVAISIPVMNIGIKAEQDSLLVNGVAVLEIIIPAFSFVLTQLFILLFDKEDTPIIVIATSLLISIIGDLITIGYYHMNLSSFSNGQGSLNLIWSATLVMMLSLISLQFYSSLTLFSHHPKQRS